MLHNAEKRLKHLCNIHTGSDVFCVTFVVTKPKVLIAAAIATLTLVLIIVLAVCLSPSGAHTDATDQITNTTDASATTKCEQKIVNRYQKSFHDFDFGCGNDFCDFGNDDFSCNARLSVDVDENCKPTDRDGKICNSSESLHPQDQKQRFYATLWFNLPDMSDMKNISCSEVNIWNCTSTFSEYNVK